MGPMESQLGVQKITRNLFSFMYIIGRGGFGKVWKVSYKKGNGCYALKEMSKVKIIDRKSERSVMSERSLLSILHNPFIVNMLYSFQDYNYLYLISELMAGGDLRYHLVKNKRFNEEQAKFFMACIILGLEYIHENGVIHRDIKPENLVLDEKGYVRITDFGIASKISRDNEYDTSGTPGYMSPEVLCSQPHSFSVDYFALGVIGYEFMLGTRPYHGRTKKELKQNVLAKQVQIKPIEVPIGWSFEAANLINQLLQRKPEQRLGTNGISEIKSHPWFNSINWNDLYDKHLFSPFVLRKGDNFDKQYCNYEDKVGLETEERYKLYRSNDNFDSLFYRYTCNNIHQDEKKQIASPISSASTKSSPEERKLKYYTTNSPQQFNLNYTPNQSNSIYKPSKKQGLYLGKVQIKIPDKSSSSKDTLPIINPNCKSLQKSFSSMSVYKTNGSISQSSKKTYKERLKLNLYKASPIMLANRLANFHFSNYDSSSIPIKESE